MFLTGELPLQFDHSDALSARVVHGVLEQLGGSEVVTVGHHRQLHLQRSNGLSPVHLRSRPSSERGPSASPFGGGDDVSLTERDRFATPADSPRHDGSAYRGLHVRRWGLGFAHRSRTILCRAAPNLALRFATFPSLYAPHSLRAPTLQQTDRRGGVREPRRRSPVELSRRCHRPPLRAPRGGE